MRIGFAWNPQALPGIAVVAATTLLAVLVYRARPGHWGNRYLAAALFVGGLAGFLQGGLRFLVTTPQESWAGFITLMAGAPFFVAFHFLFVSTLDVPWLSAVRRRTGSFVVVLTAAGLSVAIALNPLAVAAGVHYLPEYDFHGVRDLGPIWAAVNISVLASSLLGVAAALHARRRARTPLAKRHAGAVAWAFGAYQTLVAGVAVWSLFLSSTAPRDLVFFLINFYGLALASFVFAVMLGLSMLRLQVFDVDLRLKFVLNRGTLAAIFLFTFLVVGQVAEALAARIVGDSGWVLGAVAAGALLFALTPLQQLASRVADRALPDVHDTEEYRTYRKLEVYRAAVEGMYADGRITPKERRVLERVRSELGIQPTLASQIEAHLQPAAPGHRARREARVEY